MDEQSGGALRAGSDRSVQSGREPATGAAADFGASVWGEKGMGCCWDRSGWARCWGAAALPSIAQALVGGWPGCIRNLFVCRMVFAAGRVQTFGWLNLVLFVSGVAWIGILACLNVACADYVAATNAGAALSMYILVLQGGMAVGSAAWGALATRVGVPITMSCSALALLAGLLTVRRFRLTSQELELAPSVVRD